MVDQSIQLIVRRYLHAVEKAGIHARKAVLFGSYAREEAHQWSDIDLIVIAPELDQVSNRDLTSKLWELRTDTDSRIEPIPCGEREWEENQSRPILEIARSEGIVITI